MPALPDWSFAPAREEDFEPLLVLRTDVMRADLERVGRYTPERSRRVFREHFDEPGMRLVTVGGERVGCVGFRTESDCHKIDSLYLDRRFHNSGLGTAIMKALLAESDATGLPVRLEVLIGSKAHAFYQRLGFLKLGEDAIEAEYERPASR